MIFKTLSFTSIFECYKFLAQSELISRVWPVRCKFFMWTLMLDLFLTADKFLLRQWHNKYLCLFGKEIWKQQLIYSRSVPLVSRCGGTWLSISIWSLSIRWDGLEMIFPYKSGTWTWSADIPRPKERLSSQFPTLFVGRYGRNGTDVFSRRNSYPWLQW
jgi:hypothetical protein